jgi:hypothetical protein
MTLTARSGDDFEALFKYFQHELIQTDIVATGEWQSQDISDKPMLATYEMTNVSFDLALPAGVEQLAEITGAHLPWAEDHFQERVGGEPLNPPPAEEWWPFAQKVNRDHKSEAGGKFSHTYPERMWPKWAGETYEDMSESISVAWEPMHGIRFDYGDLQDVVNQLARGPLTRQAYLPIWFPEDTGAVHGKRVPCTLGYHFMIRNNLLQITYYMRSCDLIRHFQDDVYMAGRLAQWVVNELNSLWTHQGGTGQPPLKVGSLYMHIVSLHCFAGDQAMMSYRDKKGLAWNV